MLLPDRVYHLYNHANGYENLFAEEKNYIFFLERVSKYLSPVCNLYAYCLMPNHFHLLVGIKQEMELVNYFMPDRKSTGAPPSIKEGEREIVVNKISKSFSNLFNGYTQAFNKMYDRMGSLFMQNMKNKEVRDDSYFCKLVHYIHANPVRHLFVKNMEDWQHSSYKILLNNLPTKLERNYVLDAFGGLDKFIEYHQQPGDTSDKFFD